MVRLAGIILFSSAASLLLGGAVDSRPQGPDEVPGAARIEPAAVPSPVPPPAKPEPPKPPTVDQALRSGVLIVISKPSQRMHVFKDGVHWRSTPVSTGRRSKPTPTGVFPILQKKVRHRSNLYGASMPYMQRLTWDGIALHAGYVPGYPASHGCVRMPNTFARDLFGLTSHASTAVLVTNERLSSHDAAYQLASGAPLPRKDAPRLAEAAPNGDGPPSPSTETTATTWAANGPVQTIQLAASASPRDAAAYWQRLRSQQPRLATLEQAIIPAVVNGRQVYRLRASAPGAHGLCGTLKSEGIACLKV